METEHQNEVQPQFVNLTVTFNDANTGKRLSNVSPYDYCNVGFQISKNFIHLIARVTKEGEEYGLEKGTQLHELTGTTLSPRPAYTDFGFEIKANKLTDGDGVYRIGLYVQDIEHIWNYEYLLLTLGSNPVQDSNNNSIYVIAKEDL